MVAINVGPTISVGEAESYFIRIAMTVVGMIVKLEVLIARNVIIDLLAESLPPFSFFSCSMAFIPSGVAALPRPNIFAIIFDRIYPIAG